MNAVEEKVHSSVEGAGMAEGPLVRPQPRGQVKVGLGSGSGMGSGLGMVQRPRSAGTCSVLAQY